MEITEEKILKVYGKHKEIMPLEQLKSALTARIQYQEIFLKKSDISSGNFQFQLKYYSWKNIHIGIHKIPMKTGEEVFSLLEVNVEKTLGTVII